MPIPNHPKCQGTVEGEQWVVCPDNAYASVSYWAESNNIDESDHWCFSCFKKVRAK